MTDALPRALIAQLEDPFAQLTGNLAGTRRLQFEVVASDQVSPHFQRLELTAPELDGFAYDPGLFSPMTDAELAEEGWE